MGYQINNYRFKKFGNNYFVTSDHGSYCVLSEEEFEKLKQDNIDEELKQKLIEKEILLDETNMGEAVRLMRNRDLFLFSGTSLHIVVVTRRCNMSCIYCHASAEQSNKKELDMDKETARKTVDFIFQTPSKGITIEFQGGEPLLNWEIIKYMTEYSEEKNKTAKKDMIITIVTNMSKMDEEKMNYLVDHGVSVCTSLDGPKELHDHNRKFVGGSNYEVVIKWIKRFREEYEKRGMRDKRIGVLLTLTRKSLDYPKEIIDEYVNLNLSQIHLRFLNNLGVARKMWSDLSYPSEDYMDFWKVSVEYLEELKKQGKKINEKMVSIMVNKISRELDPNYLDLRSPCGAVIGQLAYNYNGDIYTCDEARMIDEDLFRLGNVKNDEYKEITTCDKACATVSASINDQYLCDDCVYKPYCGVCPVCNYVEQGSVIGKISQTDRCKIYKKQFDWVVEKKFINPVN